MGNLHLRLVAAVASAEITGVVGRLDDGQSAKPLSGCKLAGPAAPFVLNHDRLYQPDFFSLLFINHPGLKIPSAYGLNMELHYRHNT